MEELIADLSPEEIRARWEAARKLGGSAVRIRRQPSPSPDTIVKDPAAAERAIDKVIDHTCGMGMAKLLDNLVAEAFTKHKQRAGKPINR